LLLTVRYLTALVDNNCNNLLVKAATTASSGRSGASAPLLSNIQTTASTDVIVRGQDRACLLRRVRSINARNIMDTLFPRVFVLHVMLDDEEFDELLDLDVDAVCRQNDLTHTHKSVFLSVWEQSQLLSQSQAQTPHTPHTPLTTPFTPQSHTPLPPAANSLTNSVSQSHLHINTSMQAQTTLTILTPAAQVYYRSPSAAAHLIFKLPRVQVCSLDLLESDGVYVLDDAICGYLWLFIGRNVPEQSLMEWFVGLKPGKGFIVIVFLWTWYHYGPYR
jgi:hypothetical protein